MWRLLFLARSLNMVMERSLGKYFPLFALPGVRAYLFAFRVREGFQNKGYGTYLLKTVLSILKENDKYFMRV